MIILILAAVILAVVVYALIKPKKTNKFEGGVISNPPAPTNSTDEDPTTERNP